MSKVICAFFVILMIVHLLTGNTNGLIYCGFMALIFKDGGLNE